MPTAYERHLIATYLANACARLPHWDEKVWTREERIERILADPGTLREHI